MDLHRLEVFCKVVELKSFTKAGEEVFLSQPTVSEHIRSLEETLGEKLIDRVGREALPTQAGKILHQYARKILRLRNEAVQAIAAYRGTVTGELLLGAGSIPGTYWLPQCIGSFKTAYPFVQISLHISGSRNIAEKVGHGEIELGVIGARWNDPDLEWEDIFFDELVLVAHPSHRWAGQKDISMAELEGEPLLLRERDSGTRKVVQDILEEHGVNPKKIKVVAEIGSTEGVRQGIKAGIGVGFLSRLAVAEDLAAGTLRAVTIEGLQFHRSFYMIRRKNRAMSPVCSKFCEHLRTDDRALRRAV